MFYRIQGTKLHRLQSDKVIELSPLPILARERLFMLLRMLQQELTDGPAFAHQFDSSPEIRYISSQMLKLFSLDFSQLTLLDFEALFFQPGEAIAVQMQAQQAQQANKSTNDFKEPELNVVIGSLWHSTESYADVYRILDTMTYDDINSLLAVRRHLQEKPEDRAKNDAKARAKDLMLKGMRSGAPLSQEKAGELFARKGA